MLKYNQGDKKRIMECNLALGWYLNNELGIYKAPLDINKLNIL